MHDMKMLVTKIEDMKQLPAQELGVTASIVDTHTTVCAVVDRFTLWRRCIVTTSVDLINVNCESSAVIVNTQTGLYSNWRLFHCSVYALTSCRFVMLNLYFRVSSFMCIVVFFGLKRIILIITTVLKYAANSCPAFSCPACSPRPPVCWPT